MSLFREILYKKLFESFKKSASDKSLKDIQCKTNDVWRQYKKSSKTDKELEVLVLKRIENELRKATKKKPVFLDYFIKIEEKEYLIHHYQKQLEQLESLLGKRIIDSEERSRFEKEINELKDDLFKTEKELKHLRRENRKVFLFGLAIFILMVMILFYYKY